MPPAQLNVSSPSVLSDASCSGRVRDMLLEIGRLAGVEISFDDDDAAPPNMEAAGDTVEIPVQYRGKQQGFVRFQKEGPPSTLRRVARTLTSLLEHLVDREAAIGDLAEEMITCYEEINMLYALMPHIAARVHVSEVGDALVDETARTLNCRRVSLLMLNDERTHLEVVASRGLPEEARTLTIPVGESVSGRALEQSKCWIVNDLSKQPDLLELSRGRYQTDSFAAVRVPLEARGEPVGILTATERIGSPEFTSRDRKMLEGLSSMGASALLNCRLHEAVNRQMVSTIRALASAIDAKDQYTHAHSARVAQLAVATASEMGSTRADTRREVELAGLLHDIGKIGIPDAILLKTGRLTPDEFATVQRHTDIGAGIVEHVEGLEDVARAVRHHHERYDGLGYPAGLARDSIPLTSRLISVADVFDVLTSDRPYRKGIAPELAAQELSRCKGTQFDPDIVDAFLRVITREIRPQSDTPAAVAASP